MVRNPIAPVSRFPAARRIGWRGVAFAGVLAITTACSAPRSADVADGQPQEVAPSRTLVLIARDIPSLASKPVQSVGSGSARGHVGLFNSTLTARDEAGNPAPRLAETVPQLNTDTWRVFPDGRMETRYRLRANLAWQDGEPLTAQDFVFSWRVYLTPDFGTSGPPVGVMDDVRAVDSQTMVIQWKALYPEAGELGTNFPPLPRHILEKSFRELDHVEFTGLPFWVSEYVGLGPYRVQRYEPGSWIEATAFEKYVLGRPAIDRVQVSFILDPTAAVAHLLAGEAHYVTDFIIGPDDGLTLERQWQSRGLVGHTLMTPQQIRFTSFQFRPELMSSPDLNEPRVRKAIAHSIDNPASLEAITYGRGKFVTVPIPDNEAFWPIFEGFRGYAYDPRRAQQLLEEAGYSLGPDRRYRAPGGRPFTFEFGFITQASNDRENAIWVDNLRQVGLDAVSKGYVQAQLAGVGRSSFPALFTGSGTRLTDLNLDAIPSSDNRYQGSNYGGWKNDEYDRLVKVFEVTLESSTRNQFLLDMGRLYYDHLPGLAHYLTPIVNAWSPNLDNVPTRAELPRVNPVDYAYKWSWTR